jgi:cupin 2 domain-containing protein
MDMAKKRASNKQVTDLEAGNVFADIATSGSGEREGVRKLLARSGLKIERIVSHGHASPPGFWYEQSWNEWVIVLSGSARLWFEDEPDARPLAAGDHIFIRAKKRHRVDWTSETEPTVWLAVHFGPEELVSNGN